MSGAGIKNAAQGFFLAVCGLGVVMPSYASAQPAPPQTPLMFKGGMTAYAGIMDVKSHAVAERFCFPHIYVYPNPFQRQNTPEIFTMADIYMAEMKPNPTISVHLRIGRGWQHEFRDEDPKDLQADIYVYAGLTPSSLASYNRHEFTFPFADGGRAKILVWRKSSPKDNSCQPEK